MKKISSLRDMELPELDEEEIIALGRTKGEFKESLYRILKKKENGTGGNF